MGIAAKQLRRGGAGGGGAIGANLYGYGHSYMSGVGAGAAGPYFTQLATGLASGSSANRAVSGSTIPTIMARVMNGGAASWVPETPGVVVVDCNVNEILLEVAIPSNSAGLLRTVNAYTAGLTSLVRYLRSAYVVPNTDPSISYSSGWTAISNGQVAATQFVGGRYYQGSVAGATATVAGFVPTEIQVIVAAAQSVNFSVSVGGTTYGTFTTGYSEAFGAFSNFGAQVFRVTGMPAGAKNVVITRLSGSQDLFFGGYLVPSAKPPAIVLMKDVQVTNYGSNWTGNGPAADTQLAALNMALEGVAASSEFGGLNFVGVGDVTPSWVKATMLDADGLHPNNLGHITFYQAARAAALRFPRRIGLTSSAVAPDAPTGLTAFAQVGKVALSWTPAAVGGSAITDYVVQYRTTAGPGSWTTFTDGTSTATTATVTGLTGGTSYDFQVAAVNAIGTSSYSTSATATPSSSFTIANVPGVKAWLKADAISIGAVTTWTDSSSAALNPTQGTSGNRPVNTASQINGLPAVVFTASSSHRLVSPGGLAVGSEFSLFTVMAPSGTNTQFMFDFAATSNRAFISSYVAGTIETYQNPRQTVGTFTSGTFAVYEWRMSYLNGTSIALKNGTQNSSTTPGAIATGPLFLGCSNATNGFSDVKIAEWVICDTDVGSTVASDIRASLGAKYGITVV